MRSTFLLALAAVFVSRAAHAEALPSGANVSLAAQPTAIPSPDAALPKDAPPISDRPMISQGDPAVRSVRFGNTTVGRAGCLAISMYDALASLGRVSTDPATFIRTLSAYGLFTHNGLLRWSFGSLYSVVTDRFTISGVAALQKATAALSSGAQVLLEVVTSRGTKHWVRVTRVINGDAEIRDPNGGRTDWLGSSYGVKSVRGMAMIMAN